MNQENTIDTSTPASNGGTPQDVAVHGNDAAASGTPAGSAPQQPDDAPQGTVGETTDTPTGEASNSQQQPADAHQGAISASTENSAETGEGDAIQREVATSDISDTPEEAGKVNDLSQQLATAMEEVTAARKEADDLKQQLAIALQEMTKHKKNVLLIAEDRQNIQSAMKSFALATGDVRNILETALDPTNVEHTEKMREGIDLTLSKLVSAMEKHSIQQIKPNIGDLPDPNFHNAIGQMPESEEAAAKTIAAVAQAGYMLNGQVIRAADVIIAMKMEDNKDADEADQVENNGESKQD